MKPYQREFLDLCLALEVLRFGEFTLKSGRRSPYFFNAGRFDSGASLRRLGSFYAAALVDSGIEFDALFGPAYKGIPLAAAVAMAFDEHHGRDVPFCFNRKEAKDHGEGGRLVGAALEGRVLVVDDVISAGTSIGEAAAIIDASGAEFAGVAIALDRQERGHGEQAASREVVARYGGPVISIASLDTLIDYLEHDPALASHRRKVVEYRAAHGPRS